MYILPASDPGVVGYVNISNRSACSLALLIMGGVATAAQILIIRELLVVFHGSELSIGIILGSWLILEAAGSYFARERAARTRRHHIWFSVIQVAVGAGCIASILFIRSFKYLFHIPSGEILGFTFIAFISFTALVPVAVPDGILFPLGCRGYRNFLSDRREASWVYFFQAFGAFIAALFFVFYLLYTMNSIALAGIILFFCFLSAVIYLAAAGVGKGLRIFFLCLGLITLMGLFTGTEQLHRLSAGLLWHEHELLHSENSVYANISVIQRDNQKTFLANGLPYAFTPKPTLLIEEKAHFPLLFHVSPKKILLLGGGPGGMLGEILKHPVEEVDYAEMDPLIITTFERYGSPLTRLELDHEAVNIHHMEGRLYLKQTEKKYDLILVNLPPPSTLHLNRYYTAEFFRLVSNHLKTNGLFSISLPGSETLLIDELKALNQTVYATLASVFQNVEILVGDENIFLASQEQPHPSHNIEALIARLTAREISDTVMTPPHLRYRLDPLRYGQLAHEIKKGETKETNHDQYPTAVLETMVLHNMATSPLLSGFLMKMKKNAFLLSLFAFFSLLLLFSFARGKTSYVTTAVLTTGFAGMFMNIICIMAFQIFYGHVYHYLGLLIALFMLGLALGSLYAIKTQPRLVPAEAAILIHILLVYAFFSIEPESSVLAMTLLFTFSFLSGGLTGAEFPIAVSHISEEKTSAGTGSRLYAVDLVGAFAAALITPVILLPIAGVQNSLLLLFLIKTASLVLVSHGVRKKMKT